MLLNMNEWLGIATLCATIVGSMVTFAFWLGKKQTDLIVEIERVRADMHAIETDWERRLEVTRMQLEKKITEGPPYLKEMLDRTGELLKLSGENATTAIKVAEQHGTELNEIREKLDQHQTTLKALTRKRQDA